MVQSARLTIHPVRQDCLSLRNNWFKSSLVETWSDSCPENPPKTCITDERNERTEKIASQPANNRESEVHPSKISRLIRLTRLNSTQKLSNSGKQDIHFIHQVHPEVHSNENTVEALTTNKTRSFISFILFSRC
jgi:hypothetical protein